MNGKLPPGGLAQGYIDGQKVPGFRFDGPASLPSSSPSRKEASAMIAKIPLPLASWIARCYASPPARTAAP